MKSFCRLGLSGLMLVVSSSVFASQGNGQYDPNTNPFNTGVSDLKTYLLNLGQYFGYDIKTYPPNRNSPPLSSTLLNMSATQVIQNYMFNSFLGALLVNTAAQENSTAFVPSNTEGYSTINAFANYTFASPSYASPSPQQVSVSSLIDQQTYQSDPVSQAVLNIIATPDHSFCMNYDGSQWSPSNPSSCQYLFQNKVMMNVIGTLPSTYDFFTFKQNQPLLSQLNSNSLISPLLYSSTSNNAETTSSGTANSTNKGLEAPNQAQQAANFIRYATGAVAPLTLPNLKEYDMLYLKAQNTDSSYTLIDQMQAQATLANYLTSLRVFAAQSSVGISNLYYILSRRLPQSQSATSSGQQTSQALSEFTMATWRLYNPDQTPNTQWISQINQASHATVQKEMAILLAEINYQMYLSRQQQERLLLTNSMLLMQNARGGQPNASFNSTSRAAND